MAPKKKQTSVVPMDASATARKSVTADAEPSKKKTEAWGATTSSSSSASVTNSVAAAEPTVGTDHRVYLSIPYDLCGLVVSSWLVPTVKRPLRGVKTFIFAALVQTGVLGYMLVAMWTADPAKSPCPTPALLQLLGLYIFMAAMATELNSVRILQIALVTTKLKVPGGPELEAGTSRKLVMGKDLYIDVRPSSRKQRYLLALAPLTELVIEIATLCIGSLYLVVSESIEDLILNAVAVNFVTQIDEICLHAFVNKASRERLSKYLVEQKYGIEDGDTGMKNASAASKRIETLKEYMPFLVLLLASAAVAAGQVYGRFISTTQEATCTWYENAS